MAKFLLILSSFISLLLSTSSCMEKKNMLDLHKFDQVDLESREQEIAKLYRKANLLVDMPYGELIIKQDLLKLSINDKQFDNCPVSPVFLYIHKVKATRYNFAEIIKQLMVKIDTYKIKRSKIYEILLANLDSKIKAIDHLVNLLDIDDRYGALDEIKRLINQHNHISERNPFKILGHEYHAEDSDILKEKLDLLGAITSLTERLPIMNPMPASVMIHHFGSRFSPLTMQYEKTNGIDYRGNAKNQIYAAGKGIVIKAGYFEELGNSVVLDHGNDIKTVYSHLEFPMLVQEGDEVEIMQPLGIQKLTMEGSTSNYFHYEVRLNDKPVDPRIFLKVSRLCNFG